MSILFPTALDTATQMPLEATLAGGTLGTVPHSKVDGNHSLAIMALEAIVGITNSAVTTSHDYRIRQLETSPGGVTSVNTLTGAVTLTAALVGADVSGAAAAAQAASQPLDADLTAIAALTTTTFGRSLLTPADASAARTLLGLGTAATANTGAFDLAGAAAAAQAASQPLNSGLTSISALTTTAFGRGVLTLADAAAGRTNLGLGTAALISSTAGGDLTGTLPSPTIAAGAVTLAKMANLAANSFLGNNTGSAATPIALTVTEAKTLLALVKGDVGLGNVDNTADASKTFAASQITSATIAQARLGTGSDASGNHFLADDQTYKTVVPVTDPSLAVYQRLSFK